MKIKPRYYQQKCFESFFEFASKNHGKNPLLVLPTGSGKTICQTMIVKKILTWKQTRILLLSHQKELLKQNATELYNYLKKDIDIGVNSAGLKKRDISSRIIVAGIQSVHKKAWELGFFDLILVDEAHLINSSNTGMYRRFLGEMHKINKNVVICGLTASPFRLKSGLLTEGDDALFDDICYEVTIKELINPDHPKNLDNKQYLCNLISKNSINKVDLSGVHIQAGDYNKKEMQQAFLKNDLVEKAVNEIIEFTQGRKKVLIFCAGIKHCEEVTRLLKLKGQRAENVHSKKNNEENDKNIFKFKNSEIKFLLNVNSLTTGFNEKAIDCIVLLRSTVSPGLLLQAVGRGFRLHPDKKDCLILDFGRNIERLGPIDKLRVVSKKKKKKEKQDPIVKECPECRSLLYIQAKVCPDCGYDFPIEEKPKHEETACNKDVLSVYKKPEELIVKDVSYWKHQKKGKIPTLRVDYYISDFMKYSKWICIEHDGYAKRKAFEWLRNVTDNYNEISTIEDALELSNNFKKPETITVDINGKYPEIIGFSYPEEEKEYNFINNIEEKSSLESLIF